MVLVELLERACTGGFVNSQIICQVELLGTVSVMKTNMARSYRVHLIHVTKGSVHLL